MRFTFIFPKTMFNLNLKEPVPRGQQMLVSTVLRSNVIPSLPLVLSFKEMDASSFTSTLRTHLNKHSGLKSNKCNQCDFMSSYASALRKHLKTHTGEKSNKCNPCRQTEDTFENTLEKSECKCKRAE